MPEVCFEMGCFLLMGWKRSWRMTDLESLLRAAQGYETLGLFQEAYDELEMTLPDEGNLDVVLEFKVRLLFALKSWGLAREIAQRLRKKSLKESQYVIWEAYATRRVSGLEAAHKILMEAREAHAEEEILHFNLACYAVQLGNLEEGRKHLAQAIELNEDIRLMIDDEPDLEPFWDGWNA